jgi:hypothetical protein
VDPHQSAGNYYKRKKVPPPTVPSNGRKEKLITTKYEDLLVL